MKLRNEKAALELCLQTTTRSLEVGRADGEQLRDQLQAERDNVSHEKGIVAQLREIAKKYKNESNKRRLHIVDLDKQIVALTERHNAALLEHGQLSRDLENAKDRLGQQAVLYGELQSRCDCLERMNMARQEEDAARRAGKRGHSVEEAEDGEEPPVKVGRLEDEGGDAGDTGEVEEDDSGEEEDDEEEGTDESADEQEDKAEEGNEKGVMDVDNCGNEGNDMDSDNAAEEGEETSDDGQSTNGDQTNDEDDMGAAIDDKVAENDGLASSDMTAVEQVVSQETAETGNFLCFNVDVDEENVAVAFDDNVAMEDGEIVDAEGDEEDQDDGEDEAEEGDVEQDEEEAEEEEEQAAVPQEDGGETVEETEEEKTENEDVDNSSVILIESDTEEKEDSTNCEENEEDYSSLVSAIERSLEGSEGVDSKPIEEFGTLAAQEHVSSSGDQSWDNKLIGMVSSSLQPSDSSWGGEVTPRQIARRGGKLRRLLRRPNPTD